MGFCKGSRAVATTVVIAVLAVLLGTSPASAAEPSAPRTLVATVGATGITVTWRAPAVTGGAGALTYVATLESRPAGVTLEEITTTPRAATFSLPAPGLYRAWPSPKT
jgi:hypothetical protein